MALHTTSLVGNPILGKIKITFKKRKTLWGSIVEENSNLTILDLPQSATPLPGNPDRVGAFLGKSNWINTDHTAGIPDCFGHVFGNRNPDFVIRPWIGANKSLKSLPVFSKNLGHRFRTLPWQTAQEGMDVLNPGVTSLMIRPEHGVIGLKKAIKCSCQAIKTPKLLDLTLGKGRYARLSHRNPPWKSLSRRKDTRVFRKYKEFHYGPVKLKFLA